MHDIHLISHTILLTLRLSYSPNFTHYLIQDWASDVGRYWRRVNIICERLPADICLLVIVFGHVILYCYIDNITTEEEFDCLKG